MQANGLAAEKAAGLLVRMRGSDGVDGNLRQRVRNGKHDHLLRYYHRRDLEHTEVHFFEQFIQQFIQQFHTVRRNIAVFVRTAGHAVRQLDGQTTDNTAPRELRRGIYAASRA